MRLPLLVFHITAGVLAMFAGAAAISFRKGSRWHRNTGNIFVVAMLCMAAAASWLAYMKHQPNNVFGGILTIYMVATAWATARRRDGETGILDWLGFLFALSIGGLSIFHGFQKMAGREPVDAGTYPFMQLFMGSIVLLTCACWWAGFPASGGLRDIFGACASDGLLPPVRSSWDSNRYFPLACGDHRCCWWRPFCH